MKKKSLQNLLPVLRKKNNNNHLEQVNTIQAAMEGIKNLQKNINGEMTGHLLKLVEMGHVKPINPIIISNHLTSPCKKLKISDIFFSIDPGSS